MRKHKPICDWLLLALLLSSSWSLSGQDLINDTKLNIDPGITVYVEGDLKNENEGEIILDGDLSLKGDVINNSNTLLTTGMGTFLFASTSGEQSVGGSNESQFYHLTQNNTAGLKLNQRVYVDGKLSLLSGGIDLNGHTIDLRTTGEIENETDATRIHGATGKVRMVRNLVASDSYNIAGIGIGFNSAANLGQTTIERRHGVKNIGNGVSIERSFTLIPTNDGMVSVLYFNYLSSELNDQNSNSLFQWHNAEGTPNWVLGSVPPIIGNGYSDGGPYNSIAGQWTLSSEQVTSTKEQLPAQFFRLYPNPMTNEDLLRIEGLEEGVYQLQLTSITGQQLWQHGVTVNFAETIQEYQLPDLPDGVYNLQIISDRHAPTSQNIIIQSN